MLESWSPFLHVRIVKLNWALSVTEVKSVLVLSLSLSVCFAVSSFKEYVVSFALASQQIMLSVTAAYYLKQIWEAQHLSGALDHLDAMCYAWSDVWWPKYQGFPAGVKNIMAYSWPSHCKRYLDNMELEKRFLASKVTWFWILALQWSRNMLQPSVHQKKDVKTHISLWLEQICLSTLVDIKNNKLCMKWKYLRLNMHTLSNGKSLLLCSWSDPFAVKPCCRVVAIDCVAIVSDSTSVSRSDHSKVELIYRSWIRHDCYTITCNHLTTWHECKPSMKGSYYRVSIDNTVRYIRWSAPFQGSVR